ncbi:MAG: hypothetical protein M4D80_14400 [Myxococcota bacterium]|nr:hypothetical protein [Myxococcota bacterium]
MRAALLLVLAGCFSPDPPANQKCTDWCPPPESCIANTCQIDLGELAPNYAFVTTTTLVLSTVAALDQTCTKYAMDNELPGDFFAWVSTSTTSMRQRFAGNPARGWMRPDGKPFADRLDDIFAGKTYYPLRIAADGSDVGDATVATGTRADGLAGDTCNDLAPPMPGPITNGKADAGAESWTALGAADCGQQLHVYCFGKDRTNAVTVTPPTTGQKRAFVTKNQYSQRTVADADQICNLEAGGGRFAAMLATSARSVKDRFAGSTGPWFRPDGVLVTEDMSALLAPLELAPDRTRVRERVWFGASALDARATPARSCSDWMSASGTAGTGQSERSAGAAPFDLTSTDCGMSTEHHYYCAEL